MVKLQALMLAVLACSGTAAATDATAPAASAQASPRSSSAEEDELVIVHVPALVAVLLALEKKKGSALTEAEVIRARDEAHAVVIPRSTYEAMAKSRGYADIDPENAWVEWLEFKTRQDQEQRPADK